MTVDAHSGDEPPPWRLRRKAGVAILMLVYAAILQLSYGNLIAPVFHYLGLTWREPSTFSTVIAVLSVVVIAVALPAKAARPSDFVLWTFFLIAVAPSILVAQYADILSVSQARSKALWVAGIFLVMVWASRRMMPIFSLRVGLPPQLAMLLAAGFSLLFYTYMLAVVGARFELVALDAVQGVRGSYKELIDSNPLVGYALQIQTAVVNPLFMALGVFRRRPIVLFAGILGQVVIYAVTGYKLTILSPVVIIALGFYLTRARRLTGLALVSAITSAMATSLLLDSLSGGRFFVTIFVNRLMAAPGVLTSAYFQVFDGNPKYMWSHSFLSAFFDSPYQLSPGYYVGQAFQGVETQANVNLFGDGYANLGMLGVAIEAGVLLVVLAVLDASARGMPLAISAPSTMVAALGLANNSSFTSVLTGGMGGLIVAFALWPREDGTAIRTPTEASPTREQLPAEQKR